FRVVAGNVYPFARPDAGSDELDSVSVSAGNQLAVGVDQLFRSANFRGIGKVGSAQLGAGETDVIDSFEQHNMSDAGQPQRVSIEASQGADTEAADIDDEAIAQQPVTDYALIDHRHLRAFGRFCQPTDEI